MEIPRDAHRLVVLRAGALEMRDHVVKLHGWHQVPFSVDEKERCNASVHYPGGGRGAQCIRVGRGNADIVGHDLDKIDEGGVGCEVGEIVGAGKANSDVEPVAPGCAGGCGPDGMGRASRAADRSDLPVAAHVIPRRQNREMDIIVLFGKLA